MPHHWYFNSMPFDFDQWEMQDRFSQSESRCHILLQWKCLRLSNYTFMYSTSFYPIHYQAYFMLPLSLSLWLAPSHHHHHYFLHQTEPAWCWYLSDSRKEHYGGNKCICQSVAIFIHLLVSVLFFIILLLYFHMNILCSLSVKTDHIPGENVAICILWTYKNVFICNSLHSWVQIMLLSKTSQ